MRQTVLTVDSIIWLVLGAVALIGICNRIGGGGFLRGVLTLLNIDPIWFGVLFAMNIQIHYLSPPFAPACFFLKSVAPKAVSLQDILAAVLPFIALQAAGLSLALFFPKIAPFIPLLLN